MKGYGRKFVVVLKVEPGPPVLPENREKLTYEPKTMEYILDILFSTPAAKRFDYEFMPLAIYRVDEEVV